MNDEEYEAMVQKHLESVTHIKCRRNNNGACYNGQAIVDSIYADVAGVKRGSMDEEDIKAARDEYLNDGTLGDDGSIVCDACYAGF
jgi:hypothetical protein